MVKTADGTLNFDTKIDSSGFSSGANDIGNIVKGLGMEKILSGAVDKTVELGKKVITTGMNFETSMSQVAATMGITTDEIAKGSKDFDKLSSAAKKMGATTQFSASNAADALNYLALAGYDADTAIETLPTVLNLAAAGGMELGRASDMVTDAMSALGLETKDAGKFVDQMAKTSQKSNTSVSQLGDAILTVGGTAKILKGGMTEMNTVLGVLADNGKKGAEGGTVLRNMIQSLTAPTDQAKDALDRLGVSVFDTKGNMRSMPDIIMDLGESLDGLSAEDRQEVLSKIFNKADIGAVNSLLGVSKERWQELSDEIKNSKGTAEEMAATMNDNLNGAITQLNSALEGLAIEIYEQFSGALKDAVNVATDCVSQIVTGMQENGVPGAIAAAGNIAKGFLNTVISNAPSMITAGINLVTSAIQGITQSLPSIVSSGVQLVGKLASGIISELPNIVEAAGKLIIAMVDAILTFTTQLFQSGSELIKNLSNGISAIVPSVISKIMQFGRDLVQKIKDKLPDFLSAGKELITSLNNGINNVRNTVITSITKLVTEGLNKIKDKFGDFLSAGKDLIMKVTNGINNAKASAVNAASNVAKTALDKIKNHASQFLSAGKELIGKVAEGISNAISKVTNAAKNCVDAIKKAFDIDWSSIGANIINGIKSGITSLASSLASAAANAAKAALNAAKAALGIHSPSREFMYVGKMSIAGMAQGFKNNTPYLRKSVQSDIDDVMNSIKAKMDFVTSTAGFGTSDITTAANATRNINQSDDFDRLIKLQEEANARTAEIAKRPIYLGTQRIDRKLPKGAVPVL